MCGQQKQSNDPANNQHNPQYANYWAPLTRKKHIPPHAAQPRHTNDGAPRTRKRHQQEHRPQRPTERSDPTQHAKGRTGDCPGPRKGATTRRNVTRGGSSGEGSHGCPGALHSPSRPPPPPPRGRGRVTRGRATASRGARRADTRRPVPRAPPTPAVPVPQGCSPSRRTPGPSGPPPTSPASTPSSTPRRPLPRGTRAAVRGGVPGFHTSSPPPHASSRPGLCRVSRGRGGGVRDTARGRGGVRTGTAVKHRRALRGMGVQRARSTAPSAAERADVSSVVSCNGWSRAVGGLFFASLSTFLHLSRPFIFSSFSPLGRLLASPTRQ